jgi:hypothetical protein
MANEDQMINKSEVVGQANVINESKIRDKKTKISSLVKHTLKSEKIKSWEDLDKNISISKIVLDLSYDENDSALID